LRLLYWAARLVLPLLLLAGCTSIGNREGAEAYYNLGNAYFELGRLDESKRAYQRALELDSSLSVATYNLARLYVEEERYNDAEEILVSLLQQDRGNTIIFETLGWLSFRRGRYEEAVDRYRKSLNLGVGNAAVWYNLGQIYLLLENEPAALEALGEAVYYAPESLVYRLGLAEAYHDQARTRDAVDLLYPAFADGSRDSGLLTALLGYLVEDEEYPGALEVANAALDSLGSRPSAEAQEARALVLYYKAFTLLVGFEDTAAGLAALGDALKAGFDDAESLKRFFEYSDVPGLEEVRRLFNEHGLTPPEDSEGLPES
jgi:Flp pilus assembly protein TadD